VEKQPFLRGAENPIEDSCFSFQIFVISNCQSIRHRPQNGALDGFFDPSFLLLTKKECPVVKRSQCAADRSPHDICPTIRERENGQCAADRFPNQNFYQHILSIVNNPLFFSELLNGNLCKEVILDYRLNETENPKLNTKSKEEKSNEPF